ncbi:HAD-IA family hydrolase [Rugamonas sp.]|uniref:HAD-IA family hydrolase n=1 Tax=Rugamonas sp. TaxID=1926287 RepID=UPI0025E6A4F6|nr:HAD-IA family hydrolase [Rugamonas sp.]
MTMQTSSHPRAPAPDRPSPVADIPTGRYQAFLFDMDGTILNSIASAERIWGRWALSHGLDLAAFLPTMHGARAVDTVTRLGLPGVDAQAEADAITRAEIVDTDGIVEVAGAARFLATLPPGRWTIVTSAPRELAIGRLNAAGLPIPATMVTADDVGAGKPRPDCYLLAASRLGVAPATCLVFEDAHVGIAAGVAAGAQVVVVTATHAQPMATPHASIVDYTGLSVNVGEAEGGWLSLSLAGAD